MITKVLFENFKNLQKVEVELGNFTVLVGPNSSGKTSLLQGIHLMTQLGLRKFERNPAALFTRRWHPNRLVSSGTHTFRIELVEDAQPESLLLSCNVPNEESEQSEPVFSTNISDLVRNNPRLRRFSNAVFLHLDAPLMARPSLIEEEIPRLEQDGSGLPSVLDYIAGNFPDRRAAIEEAVREIVPQFRGFRTRPYKLTRLVQRPFPVGSSAVDVPVEETVWGHSLAVVMGNGAIIPADLVSEGTLLALGLLTLLHDPAAPALILLDDLDRALHLGAQVRLIRTLRAIQQQRPELQLVVSTHSPFMLQEVDAGEVRVMTTDTGGAAHCKGLKQHPDYEKWRTILNTGEIWANLGEDWAGRHG